MVCFAVRFGCILGLALFVGLSRSSARALAAEPANHRQQSTALDSGEAGQLRGSIVHASTGKPAVDADVRLIEKPVDCFVLPLVPQRARSDKDGQFTFDGLDPGTYLVYAFLGNETSRPQRFRFEKVELNEQRQQTKPIALQLKPGLTLRVLVTSQATGKAIPKARVRFGWTDGDDNFQANDRGEIVVPALTPEKWHLEIAAPEHACEMRDLQLTSPETRINVSLAPGGEVIGRVVNEQGQPLPGAKLAVQSEHQVMYALDQTTANEKGEFRLQYLPIGVPLRLSVSHTGFDRFETKLSIASQAPVDRGNLQLIPLPDAGTIDGQVVDKDGQPVAAATVVNEGSSSINHNSANTDAEGRFHIERLYLHVADRVLLTVRAKGFAPRQIDITNRDRKATEPFKIVLQPGHRIRGRVVNHADQPIAGCCISFTECSGAHLIGGRICVDSQGRFELDSLPLNCPLSFYAGGYSALAEQRLPLDGTDEVIVRLEPIGLIRGQVTDATTGKPISEFNVRLTFASQRQSGSKRPHAIAGTRVNPGEDHVVSDGRFELTNLTNGCVWDVIVRARQYHSGRLTSVQSVPVDKAETIVFKLQPIGSRDLTKVAGKILDLDGKPAAGVHVRLIGVEKQTATSPGKPLFTPPAEESRSSVDLADQYDEFRTAVTGTTGEFAFENVLEGLAMELVYWSDTVPMMRIDNLSTNPPAELRQLILTHERPVTVRVTINRQVFPDAAEISLTTRVRKRRIPLKDGQAEIELAGVESGKFDISLVSKLVPIDNAPGTYRTTHVARKRVGAKAGETIEVNFDTAPRR